MYHLLYNPKAGKTKKNFKKITQKLNTLGIEYAAHPSNAPKHLTALTKNLIADGAKNILVMGGDGTIHDVVCGFSNFEECTLGIIPCGTGNDFARNMNLPRKPLKALEVILGGKTKTIDFLELSNGLRAVNSAGMGIDVDILKRCAKMRVFKGRLQYLISLFISVLKFSSVKFTAKLDNNQTEYNAFIAVAANGGVFGNNLKICPAADMSDGKIDIVIAKRVGFFKKLRLLLRLLRGKILTDKTVLHQTAETFTITAPEKTTVQLDGELYRDIVFDAKIVKAKLRIFT